MAEKHSKATAMVVHQGRIFDKDFHSFYNLREDKRKEHGAQRGSGAQNVDVAHVIGDVVDNGLKEELETCKHFLVDSEMENGRHKVYNFAMDRLDLKYLLAKIDAMLDRLKCATNMNLAFGFVLKNVGNRSCRC